MLKPEEFLEEIFSGEIGKHLAPRRYLVHCSGKYSWCDEIIKITMDKDGIPLEFPYMIGTIFIKDRKPVIHVFYDVSDWYDFDVDVREETPEVEIVKNFEESDEYTRSYC